MRRGFAFMGPITLEFLQKSESFGCFSKIMTPSGRWFPLGFPSKLDKIRTPVLRNTHLDITASRMPLSAIRCISTPLALARHAPVFRASSNRHCLFCAKQSLDAVELVVSRPGYRGRHLIASMPQTRRPYKDSLVAQSAAAGSV